MIDTINMVKLCIEFDIGTCGYKATTKQINLITRLSPKKGYINNNSSANLTLGT